MAVPSVSAAVTYTWKGHLLSEFGKAVDIPVLPLTAFLFLVIAFRINASSPAMNALVLLCQLIACPQLSITYSVWHLEPEHSPVLRFSVKTR